jgi:sugar lactone lactonase YvrE
MQGNSVRNTLVFITLAALVLALTPAFSVAQDAPKWTGAIYVKGKVGLKWQDVSGVSEYNVYRKASTGEYTLLVTSDQARYFDETVTAGEVYSYKIAYVSAGTEVFSDERTVTIPGATTGSFDPPNLSGARVDRNKILLRWDKVPGAIAYNVYRSTTTGAGFEVVGNATSGRYADQEGLERGKTYYYVVTALNEEFDETPFSGESSVQFGTAPNQVAEEEEEQIVLEELNLTHLFTISQAGSNGDMNQPADVFVNSKGDIYVTDALNKRVNCFDNDGGYRFSFGQPTPKGEEADAPDGSFSYPFSIFIDSQDWVYVTDVMNNNIQVFSAEGIFVRRIVVEIEAGMELFRPNGIHVFEDGRIAATDAGNHRFVIMDSEGKVELSRGSRGSEPGQFIFPDELVVTADNTICVVDVMNYRVQEFDLEGNFIRSFGEAGQTVGTFGRPKAITLDETGRLWISDAMANAVQVFTVEGEIKSAISQFEEADIFLATPRGIFIKDGRFYVVNRLPHQVMVFKIG